MTSTQARHDQATPGTSLDIPEIIREAAVVDPTEADGVSWATVDFRLHGFFHREITNCGVRSGSKVVASISELTVPGSKPFLGNARLVVYNVSPNDNGSVFIAGDVVWENDILVRVSFLIFR